jgi:hypothetical protein
MGRCGRAAHPAGARARRGPMLHDRTARASRRRLRLLRSPAAAGSLPSRPAAAAIPRRWDGAQARRPWGPEPPGPGRRRPRVPPTGRAGGPGTIGRAPGRSPSAASGAGTQPGGAARRKPSSARAGE